jgi:hypothetical protein
MAEGLSFVLMGELQHLNLKEQLIDSAYESPGLMKCMCTVMHIN